MRIVVLGMMVSAVVMFGGCKSAPPPPTAVAATPQPPTPAVPAPVVTDANRSREQLHAVLWVQAAPEYRAAALQTYRAATVQLQALRDTRSSALEDMQAAGHSPTNKPSAVIMDLDETVLDNSNFNAMLVQQHQVYTGANWIAWVMAEQAQAVPGSVDFINAARAMGYRVVFVSNRFCTARAGYDQRGNALECPQHAATLGNLQKVLGYRPEPDELLLRSERDEWRPSDKSLRRLALAADYRIAMLVGDNLEDFIKIAAYDPARHAGHWGTDWFMLPNPMYGSWTDRAGKEMTVQEKCAALVAWHHDQAGAALCYAIP